MANQELPQPQDIATAKDELWRLIIELDNAVHGSEHAQPHHGSERIGVVGPNNDGNTVIHELGYYRHGDGFWPQLRNTIRTDTREYAEMMMLDDDRVVYEDYRGIRDIDRGRINTMTQRVELVLDKITNNRPGIQWWIETETGEGWDLNYYGD